ncbi:MAG: four helix bundle protein, partial [Clostridia bacterium]|nr:four helix bundle protein [Clostridia bacterium]
MSNIAKDKALHFAARIVKLKRFLNNEKREFHIADQVLRSGTSIGANIAEAECALSKKDFAAKIYIALKETSETL